VSMCAVKSNVAGRLFGQWMDPGTPGLQACRSFRDARFLIDNANNYFFWWSNRPPPSIWECQLGK
jgi:hypothetical protein